MFVQANHRAGAAEGQLAELRASFQPLIEESGRKDQQIASLQGQIGELAGRLEAMEEQAVELDELRQQLAEMRNDPISQLVSGDVTFKFLVTEVAPVLKAAEESAAAMLEDARVQSQRLLDESDQGRRDVKRQVDWLMTWGRRIPLLVQAVQDRLGQTRMRIEEIPERMREALLPVAETMASANQALEEFIKVAIPPDLSAPEEPEKMEQPETMERAEGSQPPAYIDLTDRSRESVNRESEARQPAWWAT